MDAWYKAHRDVWYEEYGPGECGQRGRPLPSQPFIMKSLTCPERR